MCIRDSFKTERSKNKSLSEKFEKINSFESEYQFQWLPDASHKGDITVDFKEKRERWQKSLKKDLYIYEAVHILSDLSHNLAKPKTNKTASTFE